MEAKTKKALETIAKARADVALAAACPQKTAYLKKLAKIEAGWLKQAKHEENPWTDNDKQLAEEIFDALQKTVENLYMRWMDEHEYEDIKDYGKVIDKELRMHGAQLITMKGKPFSFIYTANTERYLVKIAGGKYSYERMV